MAVIIQGANVASAATTVCTLGTLRTSIQARGYDVDTISAQNQCINDAYQWLMGQHHWTWLEKEDASLTATAGTKEYSLDTIIDIRDIISVRINFGTSTTDRYNLEYMEPEDLQNRAQLNPNNGIPEFWTLRNSGVAGIDHLHFYPFPDRAYVITIRYIRIAPLLVADSDFPICPSTYCPILVWKGAAEMSIRARDWFQHDRLEQKALTYMTKMKAQEGLRQQQNPQYVQKSGLWDVNTVSRRRLP